MTETLPDKFTAKLTALPFPCASLLLAVIALFATAFLYWATPDGPSVNSDSAVFLGGAHNLAEGRGYVYSIPPVQPIPVTHYPPGYSALLAVGILTTGDIYKAARIVSLMLFAIAVWLAGILAWQASGRNIVAGVLSSTLYAANPVLLSLHGAVYSESLFFPLSLLCVICTIRSIETDRIFDYAAAGLAAGLAAATRYTGVVWIATVPLVILIASRKKWRVGFRHAFIAGSAAALPLIAVLARNRVAGNSPTDRELIFHLVTATHIGEAFTTIASWLLPWRFSTWFSGLLITMALGFVLLRAAFRALNCAEFPGPGYGFALALVVFCPCYLIFLPMAISFMDFASQMDDRLLAPVEMLALCAFAVAAAGRRRQIWANAAILGLAMFYGRQSLIIAHRTRNTGSGYRSRAWYDQPSIRAVASLPSTALLWSNKPEGIYMSLDRPVRGLPLSKELCSLKPNVHAPAQFESILREAAVTAGYVIFFCPAKDDVQFSVDGKTVSLDRVQDFSMEEVISSLHLQEIVRSSEASVFSIGINSAVPSSFIQK